MKRSIGFYAAPWGRPAQSVTPSPRPSVDGRAPVSTGPTGRGHWLRSWNSLPFVWAASGSIALVGMLTTAPTTPAQIPPPPTSAPSGVVGTRTPPSGQQYVVFVNGNSPLLLEQIRQIEPGAFVNTVDGRSVIQVGRFNALQNAQLRADELRRFGVGATVQPVAAAVPSVTLSSPSNSYPPTAVGIGNGGSLPPLPVVAPPGGSGQGQPLAGTVPLPPNTGTAPVEIATTHGYYVVVPGNEAELASLATQVTQLGAPASQVQIRRSRLGPHVALGPLTDRTLAEQWSHYLRGSGLNARVHYE